MPDSLEKLDDEVARRLAGKERKMPGYGTSDEIAELERQKAELERVIQKRESSEKEIARRISDYFEDGEVVPRSYVDSSPLFRFALRADLADAPEFLPAREHDTDTGWDVRCAERDGVVLRPFEYAKIRLGFRMLAPKGWWLELRPRSSSHAKKHLNCLYGVIDEGFESELLLSLQWLPPLPGTIEAIRNQTLKIEFGDRIGQVIPIRRQEMAVQEVSNEEFERLSSERAGNRGGGLGSTGQ